MFDEMTLLNGNPLLATLSWFRYSSALMASSPRTAYCTFKRAGLSESTVRGRMVVDEEENRGEKIGVIDGQSREQICLGQGPKAAEIIRMSPFRRSRVTHGARDREWRKSLLWEFARLADRAR